MTMNPRSARAHLASLPAPRRARPAGSRHRGSGPASLLLAGLLVLLSVPLHAAGQERPLRIARVRFSAHYPSPPAETYAPLFPLTAGQETTASALRAIEARARRTGLFRSVSVRAIPVPGGTEIRILLWQQERVRKIRIRGNFPLLASSVRRVLAMQAGDPFDPAALGEECRRIERLFEEKGWFGTRVTAIPESDPQDGSVRVSYRIERGRRVRRVQVLLAGVERGDPGRIRKLLRTWPWTSGRRMRKRLEKVKRYYRRLGFPTAEARTESVEYNPDERAILWRVRVREGKRLVVTVEGNREISTRKILDATTFLQEHAYGLFDAEDSAEAIRRLYEGHGFPFAAVTFTRHETEGEIQVAFTVEEGRKAFIREILLEGNEQVPAKRLRERMQTRRRDLLRARRGLFIRSRWERDRDALIELYRSEGHRDVKIAHCLEEIEGRPGRLRLRVRIDEGPRYTVTACSLEGLPPGIEALQADELENLLPRPGDPFREGRAQVTARRLEARFRARGFLLARVGVETRVLPDHTARVTFHVRPGPPVLFSGMVISGNRLTRNRTIRRAFRLSEGEPIRGEALSRARERLHRLGIFDGLRVRVPGAEPGGRPEETAPGTDEGLQRPVVVTVRERKPLSLDLGARYDSDMGFEGFLSVRHENLLGRAAKGNLDLLAGQKKTEVGLGLSDPTLLDYRATVTVQGKYEKTISEAYTEERSSLEAGLYYRLGRRYTPSFSLLLDRAVVFDVQSQEPEAPLPSSSFNIFLRPQLVRDTRNDKLYPVKGSYGTIGAGLSHRAWGSRDDLVRGRARIQGYYRLRPKWILAGRLWLELVHPFGSTDEVPSTELLFCGGNDTVRGFPRDKLGPLDGTGTPLGGTTRIVVNGELRFPIYRLLHGVLFVDGGSLTNGFEELEWKSLRWAAGGGLRLHTPVGPVRLEYGYQLQENPHVNRGEFHFSLGFPF